MSDAFEDVVEIALRVAEALEKVGARYFVGGSLASSIDGEPRATNDIDFVIDMAVGKVRESRRCGKLRRVTFLRSLSFFVSYRNATHRDMSP